MAEPNWSDFVAFNGTLRGDIFLKGWKPRDAQSFLAEVKDNPTKYGISEEPHVSGVKALYEVFIKNSLHARTEAVEVICHSSTQRIWDFDTAVAYFFSAQAIYYEQEIPDTSIDLVPLLILYTKFLKLLTPLVTGKLPATTCLVLRPDLRNGKFCAFLGSSLRQTDSKSQITELRRKKLFESYRPHEPQLQTESAAPFGSCAETQPFILNLSTETGTPKFVLPIKGFAINAGLVVRMKSLCWEEFCKQGSNAYKPPCFNCQHLLSLGGRIVSDYKCPPDKLMLETIKKLEEKELETVTKKNLGNGIDKC